MELRSLHVCGYVLPNWRLGERTNGDITLWSFAFNLFSIDSLKEDTLLGRDYSWAWEDFLCRGENILGIITYPMPNKNNRVIGLHSHSPVKMEKGSHKTHGSCFVLWDSSSLVSSRHCFCLRLFPDPILPFGVFVSYFLIGKYWKRKSLSFPTVKNFLCSFCETKGSLEGVEE